MTTLVALVGRPNAGKSTLFNALARGQRALVHATPGTTRDSRRCPARLEDLEFDLLDTAGLEEGAKGESLEADLTRNLTRIARKAADYADVLVYLVDGDSGVLPADRDLVRSLRKLGKPMLLVLSKSDLKRAQAQRDACLGLGLGEPILLSAAHRINLHHLRDALEPHIGQTGAGTDTPAPQTDSDATSLHTDMDAEVELPPVPEGPIKIALLGQPNAGKSTLTNRLLGGERMLTGPMPGLTREALSHPLTYSGQRFILTDTPGLRRKAKITEDLENWSVGQAVNAGQEADVAVLLVDASTYDPGEGHWDIFENQDKKIAQTLVNAGRPLLVALTKWDAVSATKECLEEAEHQMRRTLTDIPRPVALPLSAKNGQGVGVLMKAIASLHATNHGDIGTKRINRAMEKIVARRSPPLGKGGAATNLKFARQVGANPPAIAIWGNRVASLPGSYKQFMRNMLADELQLLGVPLRLLFRSGSNPFKRD